MTLTDWALFVAVISFVIWLVLLFVYIVLGFIEDYQWTREYDERNKN